MPRSLLSTYPQKPDRFDEMLAEDGSIRRAWQPFFAHLEAATPEQMRHRLDYVRRRILENGVTYNVYADPEGADRPWELDPLPLILCPDEWQAIASAVQQRARLLNAVLRDLYGEQTLLRDGIVPSALIYGHNNFLWPCQGIKPLGDTYLHLYAADLARSPDGRWWVIADRTRRHPARAMRSKTGPSLAASFQNSSATCTSSTWLRSSANFSRPWRIGHRTATSHH
jgi:uncharacterized circularly permuted ATP-grasp superfamily protein